MAHRLPQKAVCNYIARMISSSTAAEVAQNMQRFADIGVQVFISEMDVNGCAGYSLDQERAQYHDIVAACVAQPACAAVTVWGITDKFSWLNISVNSSSPAGCATGRHDRASVRTEFRGIDPAGVQPKVFELGTLAQDRGQARAVERGGAVRCQ